MALLTGINYDPATAVSKATSVALAMTALDTTNLRASFLAPDSGNVLVRLQGTLHGSSSIPSVFLGVMDGSTVVRRVTATVDVSTASSSYQHRAEAVFTVTGLTPGAALTWDAAYGVETAVSSTGLKYGGPDDATANNAFGAFVFEVWEA